MKTLRFQRRNPLNEPTKDGLRIGAGAAAGFIVASIAIPLVLTYFVPRGLLATAFGLK
jgi:hypothetical protein